MWGLQLVPADTEWQMGENLEFTLTFTPASNVDLLINKHIFGLWEDSEVQPCTLLCTAFAFKTIFISSGVGMLQRRVIIITNNRVF